MSLTLDDIHKALTSCGIVEGATVMVHSDAAFLAQLPPMPTRARFDGFFSVLDRSLGPTGTLVLPTFTYSFTKGENFVPARTPSTVGSLTEHFRTMPGVLRSRDPIFSMAAKGPLAARFAAAEVGDSFGSGSAFGVLHREGGLIACIGCKFEFTFIHYVEQMVGIDYRFFKSFSGSIEEEGSSQPATVRYYVRDLARRSECELEMLRARMAKRGLVKEANLGRVRMQVVSSVDVVREAKALLAEVPNGLILEGQLPAAGG